MSLSREVRASKNEIVALVIDVAQDFREVWVLAVCGREETAIYSDRLLSPGVENRASSRVDDGSA